MKPKLPCCDLTAEAKSPAKPDKKPVSRADVEVLRQKIIDLIQQKPSKAATVLAEWVKQAPSSATIKKKAG